MKRVIIEAVMCGWNDVLRDELFCLIFKCVIQILVYVPPKGAHIFKCHIKYFLEVHVSKLKLSIQAVFWKME